MVVLILIALAQLAVSVLILGVLLDVAADQATGRRTAERAVRDMQQQTIQAMFAAVDAGSDVLDVERRGRR